jgi:hypothetical protein
MLSAFVDETLHPNVPTHVYRDGTSGAAPVVSGAAALVWSVRPTLAASQVRTILVDTAFDLGVPGRGVATGYGMVRADAAVKAAVEIGGPPVPRPPSLLLPITSARFQGFETSRVLPIWNGGGGFLQVTSVTSTTDDGLPWLSAELETGGDLTTTNVSGVRIDVSRLVVFNLAGSYSGSVRLHSGATTLGSIRVVMNVSRFQRAGNGLRVVAIDEDTGESSPRGTAEAALGYRYWHRAIPPSKYLVEAGEDLDGDGTFCEFADGCGWYGGPLEVDAKPVQTFPGQVARDVDVSLSGSGN